jgi:nucleoside-diphosphate-sugar epimerase
VDEDAPLNLESGATIEAVADLERQVTGAGGVVLRYGWFYGPDTVYDRGGQTAEMVRRRMFPVVGDGAGMWSFIHARDAAEATVAALDLDGPAILNVVDDEPAPLAEWLPVYASALGAKPPRHVPAWLGRLLAGRTAAAAIASQRGASNARAREQLGWSPAHASWR